MVIHRRIETQEAKALRSKRQHFAAPGGSHDRIVSLLAKLLPMGVGVIAALFPFSSPFAMAARAASGVPAWQHVAAIGWQLLWLGVTVTVAARLFRRGVLKSGGARRG